MSIPKIFHIKNEQSPDAKEETVEVSKSYNWNENKPKVLIEVNSDDLRISSDFSSEAARDQYFDDFDYETARGLLQFFGFIQ